MRAVKDISRSSVSHESPSQALDRYCSLAHLPVDEQQFCYNIDSFKKDLGRVLDLGADERRVCKKVKAINFDFCGYLSVKDTDNKIQHDRSIRGIIYE